MQTKAERLRQVAQLDQQVAQLNFELADLRSRLAEARHLALSDAEVSRGWRGF